MVETVEVWIVPAAGEKELPGLLGLLDEPIRSRLLALRDLQARAAAVAGHAALRRIVGEHLRLPVDRVSLSRGPHGRPVVPHAPRVGVSLAHTAGCALVALHPDGLVGVDAEPRGRSVGTAVLRRVCTPDELGELGANGRPSSDEGGLRWWVRKEAVAKADGRGFSIGFAQLDVRAVGPVERPGGGGPIHLRDLEVGPDHLGAIATVGPMPPLRVRRIVAAGALLATATGRPSGAR
jgi:4'-phosphopantetheinyl transferase